MLGDFKVKIIERPGLFTKRVFMWRYDRNVMEFFTHKAEVRIVKEGEQVNDDELYFAELTDDQLQAFAEALASKGIKTNKDSVADGKLAATERHLEDMRLIALSKFKAPTQS